MHIIAPSVERLFGQPYYATYTFGAFSYGPFGFFLDDPSAATSGSTVTVTLNDSAGTLHNVIYSGTLDQVQTQLYQTTVSLPNLAVNNMAVPQSDTLTIAVDDGQGNTATAQVGLEVVVPGGATQTSPATLTAVAGVATAVPGLSVADPSAAVTGYRSAPFVPTHESVTLSLPGGSTGFLLATAPIPQLQASVGGNGTRKLQIFGPLSEVNAILAGVAYVGGPGGASESLEVDGPAVTQIAVTSAANPDPGATDTWTNAAGGSFLTPGNWTPAGPPGEADTAVFGALTPGGTRGYAVGGTAAAGRFDVSGAVAFDGVQDALGVGGVSFDIAQGGSAEIRLDDTLIASGALVIEGGGALRAQGPVTAGSLALGAPGAAAEADLILNSVDVLGDATLDSGVFSQLGGDVNVGGQLAIGTAAGDNAFAALDEAFTGVSGNITIGGANSGSSASSGYGLAWIGGPQTQGNQFYTGGALTIGAGGRLDLAHIQQIYFTALDVAAGGWLGGAGVVGPDFAAATALTVDGTIEAASGGALTIEGAPTLTGSGELLIDAGSTLQVDPVLSLTGGGHIRFGAAPGEASSSSGLGGMLVLAGEPPGVVAAPIEGFGAGDTIQLLQTVTSLSYAGNTLTVNGGTANEYDLTFSGSYSIANFGSVSNEIFYRADAANSPQTVTPAGLAVAAGAALPLAAIAFNEPRFDLITATLAAGSGSLTAGTVPGSVSVSSSGAGQLTFTGYSAADIDSAIAGTIYTPASGAVAGDTDTLTVTFSDNDTTAPYSSGPIAIPIAITAARTATWTGTIGAWTDPANWTAATPAVAGDTAVFDSGNSVVQGVAQASTIRVDQGADATFTGLVQLQTTGGATAAALHVDGGANVVFDTGSSLSATGGLVVGDTGAGSLALSSGIERGTFTTTPPVTAASLTEGVTTLGDGHVFIDDETTLSGDATIGQAGTGDLTLDAQAGLNDVNATLGATVTTGGFRALGRAVVDAGSWTNSGTLTVGGAGDGQLRIEGYNPSSPPLFFDGARSFADTNGGLTPIGNSPISQIAAGPPPAAVPRGHGVVGSLETIIGRDAGSTGSVLVDQSNGDLSTSTLLAIGLGGSGTLEVVNFATAEVTSSAASGGLAEIGADIGSTGTLIVSGGTFADQGDLVVGGTEGGAGGTGLVHVGVYDGDNTSFYVVGQTTVWSTGTVDITGAFLQTGGLFVAAGGLVSGEGAIEGVTSIGLSSPPTAPLTPIQDDGTILATGGKLIVYGAVSGSGATAIGAGAELELQQGAAGTAAFQGADATLTIDDLPDYAQTITGFSISDVIHLTGVAATSATWASDVLSVFDGATQVASLNVVGSYAPGAFSVNSDTHNGSDITLCFAAGTMIATPDGERAVETLRAGDVVLTADGARPVRWVGRRRIDLRRHARPEAAAPVRIRAGAFADGMPKRDLLVSPDHAILAEGVLVPARLLVNGCSVTIDRTHARIAYHHVELDRHAILFAEGLAAESYLELGHRAFFEDADAAMTLHPDFSVDPDRAARSCAPFVVDTERLAPVRATLAARAAALGFAADAASAVPTIDDPALRLLADGRVLPPIATDGSRHVFALPAGTRSVRVLSRAAAAGIAAPVPIDDRRRLGIAIRRIVLRDDAAATEIALDGPALGRGWWAPERAGTRLWRWTDGDAEIALDDAAQTAGALLEITVQATHAYPAADAA
jgi:T5SS/PEP-CTERM-associated repeat protein